MPLPGDDPALDAETQAPVLFGIAYGMLIASLVAVALRLYTRYAIVKALGADDALIAVSAFLSIGVSISTITQTHFGLGRHFWMISDENMLRQVKALLPGMELYNTAQILTKLSFVVLYRRIFEQQFMKTVGYYLIIFLSVWGVTQNILVGFSCNPVAVINPAWNAFCVNTLTIWYLTSIMNIFTDFLVFLLPMPAIKTLQLGIQQKLLVASLFGVGFFTCVISIVRLFFLRQGVDTTDPTWDNVAVSNWTIIELNSGIICACLPAVRRFFKHVLSMPMTSDEASALSAQGKKSTSRLTDRHDGHMYALQDVEVGDSQQALAKAAAGNNGNKSQLSHARAGSMPDADGSSSMSGPPSRGSLLAENQHGRLGGE